MILGHDLQNEPILILREPFAYLFFHLKPIPCTNHKHFAYIFGNCFRQLNFAVIFRVYYGNYQNILPMPISAISLNCKHLGRHPIEKEILENFSQTFLYKFYMPSNL